MNENIGDGLPHKDLHKFTYNGPKISIDEAKEVISKFSINNEGSVDLYIDVDDGIARVCLNNPRIKNGINGKMMMDLEKVVDKLDQWTEGKGVILHGSDGNFCSGGDLNITKHIGTPEIGYAVSTYMNHILEKFRKLPMISVAYIDGTGALGGGAELTTACDYRLMCSESPATGIGFVHVLMGLVPVGGSLGWLMSVMGPQKALDLLLEARVLTASEAAAVGLVDGTVVSLAGTVDWLRRKVQHHGHVVRAVKRTQLVYLDGFGQRDVVDAECRIFAPLWGGPANREALERSVKHKSSESQ